jgi:hypothetical protein
MKSLGFMLWANRTVMTEKPKVVSIDRCDRKPRNSSSSFVFNNHPESESVVDREFTRYRKYGIIGFSTYES